MISRCRVRARLAAAFLMLGLAAIVALFWAFRIVWHGRVIGLYTIDLFIYHYPTYKEAYGRIAAGILPRWNPYQLCGVPWLATLEGGYFYPPHVLYLVLPTHVALALSGLLHLILVAVSTIAFARRSGLVTAAAVLTGLLFTLRGTIAYSLIQPNVLESAAWLPLGSLAVLDILSGWLARGIGLLGLAMGASLLAGFPQNTLYLVYGWAALLGALLLGARATPRRWLIAGTAFGAGLGVGALLGAVQLVPTFELTYVGTRGARQLSEATMFVFGPELSRAVVLLRDQPITGDQASFGIVGLSLLSAALPGSRHGILGVWALLLGTLTAALSVGPLTRLFWLYRMLPFLSWFRSPDRILLLTDFCFAVLVGIALDAIWRAGGASPVPAGPSRSPGGWSRLFPPLPIAAILALIGYVIWRGVRGGILLAAGTGTILISRAWPVARAWSRGIAIALVMLATAELFLAPSNHLAFPYTAGRLAVYHIYDAAWAALAARAGHDRVWVFAPGSVELAEKLATRHRVRAVDDYESVNLERQKEYFTYFVFGAISSDPRQIFDGRILSLTAPPWIAPPAARRRLLDIAGVRYMMLPTDLLATSEVRAFIDGAGFQRQAFGEQGVVVFENLHVLPRAFTVYRVRPAPSASELLGRMGQEGFDPLVESYVEGDPGFTPAADAPARGAPADFVQDDEQIVEVESTLAAPGLVVLADTFFTGWRATVDGVPAPILPTNHLFRGVPVPPGHHRVRFEYRPWTLAVAAAASAVGMLVLGAVLFTAKWPRALARPTSER